MKGRSQAKYGRKGEKKQKEMHSFEYAKHSIHGKKENIFMV